MNYRWTNLHAYPGYSVSTNGRVRDKWNNTCPEQRGGDGAYVRMLVNGVKHDLPVDELVAYGWHGKPRAGYRVEHLNGDVFNNAADNVEWVKKPDDFHRMMRDPGRHHRPPYAGDTDGCHGRVKVAETCRRDHKLSMTGEPDANTAIHGYGNRTCRRCWRGDLDDVIALAHVGGGRW